MELDRGSFCLSLCWCVALSVSVKWDITEDVVRSVLVFVVTDEEKKELITGYALKYVSIPV